MLVCFDIGSTLLEGPPQGPARRLVEILDLPPEAARSLSDFLFLTPLGGPEEVAAFLTERFRVGGPRARQAAGDLWAAQMEEARPLAGAPEVLASLAAAGIRMALISNIWPPFYAAFVRHFPGAARTIPAFLSFRLHLQKPDLRIYRQALEALRIPPEKAVMVGDTYRNDIAPPQRLGMRTVWILQRPEREKADLVAVLNGIAPAPDLSLAGVGDLCLEHLTVLGEGSLR